MTWLLRICFSLAAPALLSVTLVEAAEVTGSISLRDTRQKRAARDLSGVVVWLEPLEREVTVRPRRATMVQKDKTFTPHVLAIPVGSVVDFPNYDPIFHNAFSNFSGQIFDVGLYPPGTTRAVTFRRAGIVRVFCNIHPTMTAVIAVLDTPWFAQTDRAGSFRMDDVPAGEYRVRFFHERATEESLAGLTRTISVGAESLAIPRVAISEAGYIPTPHKNKYGKEYPPAPDDPAGYRK